MAPTREIEIYLIDACKQFWSVHKRAKDLNRTRLITLDQAHAKANGTTKVKKKLRLPIATQRDVGSAITWVKQKAFQPGTQLFRTTALGNQECTHQQKIPTVCIIENKLRFSQTFDTSPMCDVLVAVIGNDAEKMRKRTEENKYWMWHLFPELEHKYIQKCLYHLCKHQIEVNMGPISTRISTQEHIQRWKKQKERTSSYNGKLNFNDNKAGSQDEHIAQLDYLSRQIPSDKGFVPESYK